MHTVKIHLLILLLLFTTSKGHACTLWAYCNITADGKEIHIGKVRDTVLNHSEEVRFVKNTGELSYYGVFAVGADNEYTYNPLKAGTNVKGLTVIFSTIGTIPLTIRFPLSEIDPIHSILAKYSTVDEVLKNTLLLGGPKIVLIADKNEIAKIEIGLEGKISIQRANSGFLFATNHYVELSEQNLIGIDPSSFQRLQAVEEILNSKIASDTNTDAKIIKTVTRHTGRIQSTSSWTAKTTTSGKLRIEYAPLLRNVCKKLFF